MSVAERVKAFCFGVDHHVKRPWKNGGGTMVDLAVDGDPEGVVEGDRWRWRVGLADIDASGPFSDFSGYRRTIMLAGGKGFTLDFDQAPSERLDVPCRPFTFEGGWTTDCRLIDGPAKAFNLLWDPRRVDASLDVLAFHGPSAAPPPVADVALWHGLEGRADFDIGGRCFTVGPGDTLRIDLAAASDAPAVPVVVRDAAHCKVAFVDIRQRADA